MPDLDITNRAAIRSSFYVRHLRQGRNSNNAKSRSARRTFLILEPSALQGLKMVWNPPRILGIFFPDIQYLCSSIRGFHRLIPLVSCPSFSFGTSVRQSRSQFLLHKTRSEERRIG